MCQTPCRGNPGEACGNYSGKKYAHRLSLYEYIVSRLLALNVNACVLEFEISYLYFLFHGRHTKRNDHTKREGRVTRGRHMEKEDSEAGRGYMRNVCHASDWELEDDEEGAREDKVSRALEYLLGKIALMRVLNAGILDRTFSRRSSNYIISTLSASLHRTRLLPVLVDPLINPRSTIVYKGDLLDANTVTTFSTAVPCLLALCLARFFF